MDDYSQDKRFQYLNRNSSLPLYYQIKEHIKDAILNGEFKPNDRLPTEDELCKLYSVSRPVVRQAYDELIKEGSMVQAKEKGLVRQEGKDYIMQEGDIVLFKFNV